ncbi:MAG: exosortase C-terminal domain/associated protein EpsI, partial [Alphaproteobacteria bacterium]
ARVAPRDAVAREPVSYWMRVGDRLVTTNMDRQLAKLTDGLKGIIPDGVLVRVSTRTGSANLAADYAVQDRFIADVLANIDPKTQELLVGPGAVARSAAMQAGG